MSVVYVDRWCRRVRRQNVEAEAEVLARSLRVLELQLRAAGCDVGGDLVAAAGIALWQKMEEVGSG